MIEPEADAVDRLEQAASIQQDRGVEDEAVPPGDEVPEADALEQQRPAVAAGRPATPATAVEANEADVLEQQIPVPDDEEELRG